MIEIGGRNIAEEKLSIAKKAMENACDDFKIYNVVSEYGEYRYQNM